jgi:hypothetical protein
MKFRLRSVVCALSVAAVLVPSRSLADYQPADVALERLENIVALTPAQEEQALQIFQDLKDIMDSMSPEARPKQGAQARRDAIAAIWEILTPEQRVIYDRTPQRLGGAGRAGDPVMQALYAKIRRFVRQFAQNSPDIAAQVGPIRKVAVRLGGETATSSDDITHPDSGANLVRVTGSAGTKLFKISWVADESGRMTVTGVVARPN